MIFVGSKVLHTRDIGKLKNMYEWFFFLWGGTENLWGARAAPGPPPPRSYAPVNKPKDWSRRIYNFLYKF